MAPPNGWSLPVGQPRRDLLPSADGTANATPKPLWTSHSRPRRLVASGGRVFVGSNDGRVYGLDLVTSSPAVAKGKVVVATADGQVICFG